MLFQYRAADQLRTGSQQRSCRMLRRNIHRTSSTPSRHLKISSIQSLLSTVLAESTAEGSIHLRHRLLPHCPKRPSTSSLVELLPHYFMSIYSLIVSFPEHCCEIARSVFEAQLCHPQLKITLLHVVNTHLENVRRLTGVGPSPKDYTKYNAAMRLALKRKICY